MFKIGEFSKLTQVSIRMLRYYDEANLLKPAQTDRFTGYRLYSAEQIPHLNKLVFLRDLGFSVAEMAEALEHWNDDAIHQMLLKKQQEAEDAVAHQQSRLNKIRQAITDLPNDTIHLHSSITIKQIPSCCVISLRKVIPSYFDESRLWKELADFTSDGRIATTPATFAIYHDEDFRDSDVDVEVCDVIEDYDSWRRKNLSLPSGMSFRQTEPVEFMACAMVPGPFENIGPAFHSFAAWLQDHNEYRMAAKSRQIVHRGPWNSSSPEEFVTEIQIELNKKHP